MYQINDVLATHGLDWGSEAANQDVIFRGWTIFDVRNLLYDEPKNSLGDYRMCIERVVDLIRQGKKVCVCCSAGMSRSNAVAIGTLIKLGMPYDKAYDLVDAKVPIAQIEPCHISALQKIFSVSNVRGRVGAKSAD